MRQLVTEPGAGPVRAEAPGGAGAIPIPAPPASGPLTLVALAPAHAAILSGWFPTREAATQWGGPAAAFPLDAASLGAMLADPDPDPGPGGTPPGRLGRIALLADGAAAGTFQLRFDHPQGNAVLTCVAIAPALRGAGLARALVSEAVALAFAPAGIERLELRVFTFNAPAIRAYRGLGFVEEGVLRAAVRAGGARWDLMVMSRLRRDPPVRDRTVAD